jgi:hypothetical protein
VKRGLPAPVAWPHAEALLEAAREVRQVQAIMDAGWD